MKRKGGVAEKAPQQVATPGEATALEADVVPDVVDGVRGEVRQATVLERAPQFFDRVEFRRVRRKPDGVPAWVGGQPLAQYSIISGQVSVRRDSKCLKILVSRPGLEPGTP